MEYNIWLDPQFWVLGIPLSIIVLLSLYILAHDLGLIKSKVPVDFGPKIITLPDGKKGYLRKVKVECQPWEEIGTGYFEEWVPIED